MGERVFFESGGERLAGILSGSGRGPGVVLVHGFNTSKESYTCEVLEEELNAKGITTLRFDVYGHGESTGRFEDVTCSIAARNVEDALHFLKARGCTRLGVMGSSFGGYLGYIVAARYPGIMALALKCPVADWTGFEVDESIDEWRRKGVADFHGKRLKWTFYEDAIDLHAKTIARDIRPPVLIVHGTADDLVPIGQSRAMAELIPRCILLAIDGADHRFSNEEHFRQMIDAITAFLGEHLG